MNELTINLCLPEKTAEICRASIELEDCESGRSKIKVSCTGDGLRLYTTASDLSAMRAVLNTYMRWIIMCRELIEK